MILSVESTKSAGSYLEKYCKQNISTFAEIRIQMLNFAVILGIVGPWQIVLVVAVLLLLFGGKKIPELMKGVGGGIKEFKNAMKDDKSTPPASENKDDKHTTA